MSTAGQIRIYPRLGLDSPSAEGPDWRKARRDGGRWACDRM